MLSGELGWCLYQCAVAAADLCLAVSGLCLCLCLCFFLRLGRLHVRRGCFALFVVVVVVVSLCRVVLGIFGNWYGWWLVVLVSLIEIAIVTLGCFMARTLSRQNSLS